MAFSLPQMPTEMVMRLGAALCPHCAHNGTRGPWEDEGPGQRELSRLSRTCRRFRDILQPMVFHSFCSTIPSRYNLVRLRHALRVRADLARHMRSVALSFAGMESQICEDGFEDFENAAAAGESAGRQTKTPYESELWVDELPNVDNIMNLVEGVLLLLHNLEFLQMELYHGYYNFSYDTVQPLWPRLKYLVLGQISGAGSDPGETEHYIDAYETCIPLENVISMVHAAPNVQAVWISSLSWSHAGPPFAWGNLRRLEFTRGIYITPETLHRLLMLCSRLEVLSLRWDPLDNTGQLVNTRWTPDWLTQFWAALARASATLRELSLDFSWPFPDGVVNTRSSLRDFEQLRRLNLGDSVVEILRRTWLAGRTNPSPEFLSQVLPKGVVNVTFWGPDYSRMSADIDDLARTVSEGGYPSLKRVRLAHPKLGWGVHKIDWESASHWKEAEEGLVRGFQGAVELEIQPMAEEYWGGKIFGLPVWPHNDIEDAIVRQIREDTHMMGGF